MANLVIYHADDDGFGAAWVARRALIGGGEEVETLPANYGMEAPFEQCAGKNVYIVDFSYPFDVMIDIIQMANTVIVLDHHKTAEEALAGLSDRKNLTEEQWNKVFIRFEQGKSGVMLTWEHFYGSRERPTLIDYLDAGDLWQIDRFPDLKQVQAALRSFPYDFDLWDRFMTEAGMDWLRRDGDAIWRYIAQKCGELLQTKHPITIDGQEVYAVNAPWAWASEIAGQLAETHPPYGVCYYDRDGARTFSLRSRGDFDVAEVAKKFGGGGHKNAAGFRLDCISPMYLSSDGFCGDGAKA